MNESRLRQPSIPVVYLIPTFIALLVPWNVSGEVRSQLAGLILFLGSFVGFAWGTPEGRRRFVERRTPLTVSIWVAALALAAFVAFYIVYFTFLAGARP